MGISGDSTCQEGQVSKNFNPKPKSFTLAEVLITIGILGVIAALTIPNLIQIMQNKDLVSKYLKMHNTLTNAFKDTEAMEQMKFYKMDLSDFKKSFESQLKTISCGERSKDNRVCMSDGSEYEYGEYNEECPDDVCMELTVDINGEKKPNAGGKDKYTFLLTKEKGIVALGESSEYCKGLDCGKYVLANHKLFNGIINNCDEYTTNGSCNKCNDGYSLEGGTCRDLNVKGCEKYAGVKCTECA